MSHDNQKIVKEFKNTVKILNSYTNKFANVRIANEIKIEKRKRNAEVAKIIKQMLEELDILIEEQGEVFACRRIMQDTRILNLVFNMRMKNFDDFKRKLTNKEIEVVRDFAYQECQKIGNKYCMISSDSNFLKYGENCINFIVEKHINKCDYEINRVEIEIAENIYKTFKKISLVYDKYGSYVPPEESRRNRKEIRTIFKSMQSKLKELKALNEGIKESDLCVVNLTEEDKCYFGANDYVIHIEKADDLKIGLQNELDKNLKVVMNLSRI